MVHEVGRIQKKRMSFFSSKGVYSRIDKRIIAVYLTIIIIVDDILMQHKCRSLDILHMYAQQLREGIIGNPRHRTEQQKVVANLTQECVNDRTDRVTMTNKSRLWNMIYMGMRLFCCRIDDQ